MDDVLDDRAGSGSLTPWSAAASFVETVLSASSADFIRSGFQSPLITGLTKSSASLSHLSLSQFFQPPSAHAETMRAYMWNAWCDNPRGNC